MEEIKRKNIYLAILVIIVGLAIAGGTYAYMTFSATVNNGTYNTGSKCFIVDYTDNTQTLTGTLFPSVGPSSGIVGSVSLKVNSTCNVNGKGTLYLHVNSGTSTQLMASSDSHCENPKTLETLKDYTTQSTCVSNSGKWTNSSALKYAIYDNSGATGTPLAVGAFNNSSIGNDVTIYTDFIINSIEKTYYIYVWLDGYISDNSYTDLTFDGYIKASAIQSEELLYQKVEYIQSSGTQYIDTGFIPNQNTSVELQFNGLISSGNQDYFGTSTSSNGYSYGLYDGGSKVYDNYNDDKAIRSGHISGMMTVNKNKNVTTITGNYNLSYTHATATFTSAHSLYLFARWISTGAYRPATMKCYEFKIWDDGTLVRDFIPCYRKSDNKPGLYDIVNDVFYTNAATSGDDFTVGPDV